MRWNGENYSETMMKALRYLLFIEMRGSFEYSEMRERNIESRFSASTYAALVTRGVISPVEHHFVERFAFTQPHRLTLAGFMLVDRHGAESGFRPDECDFAFDRAEQIEKSETAAREAIEADEELAHRMNKERDRNAAEKAKYHPKPLPKREPFAALPEMIEPVDYPADPLADSLLKKFGSLLGLEEHIAESLKITPTDPDAAGTCGYPLWNEWKCGLPIGHGEPEHEIIFGEFLPGVKFTRDTADTFRTSDVIRSMGLNALKSMKEQATHVEASLNAQLDEILKGVPNPAAPVEDEIHEKPETDTERGRVACQKFREALEFLMPGHGDMVIHAHDRGSTISFCTELHADHAAHVYAARGALTKVCFEMADEGFIGVADSNDAGYFVGLLFTRESGFVA